MKDPRDIIKRPLITERTSDLMANKCYVFEVDVRANKTEIKQAVEQIFKVKVRKVNTMNMPGKPKTYGTIFRIYRSMEESFRSASEDSKELEFFETV